MLRICHSLSWQRMEWLSPSRHNQWLGNQTESQSATILCLLSPRYWLSGWIQPMWSALDPRKSTRPRHRSWLWLAAAARSLVTIKWLYWFDRISKELSLEQTGWLSGSETEKWLRVTTGWMTWYLFKYSKLLYCLLKWVWSGWALITWMADRRGRGWLALCPYWGAAILFKVWGSQSRNSPDFDVPLQ